MESFLKLHRHRYLYAAGIPWLLFSSCSDTPLSDSDFNSQLIRFNVPAVSSQNPAISRNDRTVNPGILPLKGEEVNLYLVPQIEETACSSDISGSPTRGAVADTRTIESFGVFAGYASEVGTQSYRSNYMDNVKVTRSSGWSPQEEYLWPGQDALHFNAYSPFSDKSSTEGIVTINSSDGSPELSYVIPANVNNQTDLLYASPVDASSSPCQLTFLHALTGIRFVTGSELAPCTVKDISIKGTLSSGKLNMENGEWDALGDKNDFILSLDTTLTAASNSDYVEAGIDLTSDSNIFFLMPQSLGSDAEISITFIFNGEEKVLTSSLASQEFPQGKTITYRISANPQADSLIFNITGDFNTVYKGSNKSFKVKSSLNENGVSMPVAWDAEFIDDNGNPIGKPDWIFDFTMQGSGDTDGILTTVLQEPVFENMSTSTRELQNSSDINSASSQNPYNLSSKSGGRSIENTANTYVINAPGYYSIPLVYGNAIKNGATNTQSFKPSTHNSHAIKNFTNHLNNTITSPYIYDNTSCTPADAVLVWEDEMNLIRDVKLSEDGHSLLFNVPKNSIRQGNALLAVRDSQQQIMWSWQIWVTDYSIETGANTLSVDGKSYELASQNLGYVSGGDVVKFPEVSVKVRFTQKGLPDGQTPLTKTITISQTGTVCSSSQYNPYYQWGRKDPMMSGDQTFYDASHNDFTTYPTSFASDYISGKNLMQAFILHPDTFYLGTHDSDEASANWTTYPYDNFWDGTYNTSNPKTIYDPNPVGYVVPYLNPLNDFTPQAANPPSERYTFEYLSSSSAAGDRGYYVTVKSTGEKLYFPDLGYRTGTTGKTASNGALANYWLSHAIATLKNGGVIQFYQSSGNPMAHQTTDPLFHGMSIRGVKE